MAAGGSTKVIVIALLGNLAIAISKFTAAAITGAAAMFAEAIHSLVDTGNQALLLYGVKRAEKPADARHPFGYGMEVYFWSFVVAILLFSIGAGVSIFHGIEKIRHPHPVENPMVNYVVLVLAMAFEGYAWWAAYKEMNRRRRPGEGVLQYVRRSKDAPLFTVLFEDTGAMLGLMVAFIGLLLAQALDWPALDGWASVAIGVLLAIAAITLAIETKALLIGEAADPELVRGVEDLAASDNRIQAVNEVLTMHLGPSDVLATISLDFVDNRTSQDVEASITELERAIKEKFPEVRRVFIEAQSWRAHLEDKFNGMGDKGAGT